MNKKPSSPADSETGFAPSGPVDSAQRFLTCAATYGANRNRWPQTDQTIFDALASSTWGQQVLATAEELDYWLASGDPAPAASRLSAQWSQKTLDLALAARAPRSAARTSNSPWLGALAMSMGLVLCAIGGFVHGFDQAIEVQTLRVRGDEFAAGSEIQWLQHVMPSRPSANGPGAAPINLL
jgi:hypothetical protein